MMRREGRLGDIPYLLWGEDCERLLLAVHGDMSHKADPVIAALAEAANPKGIQVLSFDLPEHGDRKAQTAVCDARNCVRDLRAVMDLAEGRCARISLFGVSLGAFFSLLAFADQPPEQVLFLSPVADMRLLIENMLEWAGVTPEKLEREGEIATSFGKTLSWDYYSYVKSRPIEKWTAPTAILHAEQDRISSPDAIARFAARFGCDLTITPDGEHFFHTDQHLAILRDWLAKNLR